MQKVILIRFGELFLKGKNKHIFEKMLLKSFKINNVLFWRKNAKFL